MDEPSRDEKLRQELLRRVEADQVARSALDLRSPPAWHEVDVVLTVDAENTAWLAHVVDVCGWPGRSVVGEDGAHAAWLLAQHADSAPALQSRFLDLLGKAVAAGEASAADLAYLTDRVLLQRGASRSTAPRSWAGAAAGNLLGCVHRRTSTNGGRRSASDRSPSTWRRSTTPDRPVRRPCHASGAVIGRGLAPEPDVDPRSPARRAAGRRPSGSRQRR